MTTTIRHHLTDEVLAAYAAGELAEAFGLVVATHLTLCDDCRARSMALDSLGGAVLETGAGAAMHDSAFAACMARIDSLPQDRPQPKASRKAGSLPQPLADYAGARLEDIRWRSLGKGVRQAILPTDGKASARLLRIPGGVAVPDHGHQGLEMTLVLQGAFSDSTGRFGPGDVEMADSTLDHLPVAERGEDCICLAATDAPLRFRSLLPKLLQPIFRI